MESITKFYLKICTLALTILIVICAATYFFVASQRKADATGYAALLRNELLLGDYRTSMIRLKLLTLRDFSQIRFVNSDGIEIFKLGQEQNTSGNIIIPVSLSGNPGNASYLHFGYDAWAQVVVAGLSWVFILMLNIPVIAILSRKLQRFYKKQEEEKTLAKIGSIARQIAHDIRSPLSALKVLGSATNFKEKSQRDLYEQVIDRLNNIAEEVLSKEKSLKAADTSLEETGNKPLEVILASEIFRNLVESSLNMKRCEWKGLGIRLRSFLEEIGNVRAERESLSRILSNALNNSKEAGATSIVLSSSVYGNNLLLEIRDNGKGISPDLLKRIKVGERVSSKDFGHGLGISSAYSVLNSWGGSLSIESTPGIGTNLRLGFEIINKA